MNLKLSSIGFLAALVIPLIPSLKAEAGCVGSKCNNLDPISQGCNDGKAVDTRYFGSYSYGPWWNRKSRQITVVLMYSSKCKANWARADVPAGTPIYVEELYKPGNVYGIYKTQTDGWSYGNMSNGNVPNRACAKIGGYGKCTYFK